MGVYKYPDPATGKWKIIKSKAIVKPDGSLEYDPDDIKEIEDRLDSIENDVGDVDNKFDAHKADKTNPHVVTKTQVGLGNVDNVKQASKIEFDAHKAERATQNEYGHIRLQDIPNPEVATKAEAEAGTNNTKMMTPLRVAEAFDSKVGFFDDGTIGGKQVNLLINGEWVLFREVVDVSNLSWSDVRQIVRAGDAGKYFDIGDQLVSLYDGEEIIWQVIGIDVDTPSDSQYTHSLTIQVQNCIANIQFDASESSNPDSGRKSYGNSRYIHSAIRQWLNSNAGTFQWQSQHQYDAPPTNSLDIYNGPGFLKLLDPELVAVLGTVKKQAARNTVTDDGGQDIFEDKVFLLSPVEVGFSSEGDTTGEKVYPYYQGASKADRIKLLNGSARNWWLRSPYVSFSYRVRYVYQDGSLSYYGAYRAYGAAPACVII